MSSPETELVAELRALAGVGDQDRFVIEREPNPFEVRYRAGSSSSLTFSARYDAVARADHEAILHPGGTGAYRRSGRAASIVAVRPLAITLRHERPSDVEAKRAGINVEYQTGDDDFDRNVYVATPTTDAQVLNAVLGPRVRQGVLALHVLGFQYVKIDENGCVEAYLCEFTQRQPRPGRGKSAVEAFALVLSDLPAISASGGAHVAPPIWARGGWLGLASVLAAGIGLPVSCGVAEATECTVSTTDGDGETSTTYRDGCGTPAFLSLVLALLVGIGATVLARRLATPRLRGRSDSSDRILYVRIVAFWTTFVVTYVAASAYAFTHLRP